MGLRKRKNIIPIKMKVQIKKRKGLNFTFRSDYGNSSD